MAVGGDSLQFDDLISVLREWLSRFPDKRIGSNIHYSMVDIALSAFSVFFMQSPSFLDFQRTMGRSKGRHNAATLFGVSEVPSDNHIRSMLDAVPPESIYGLFDQVMDKLSHVGLLDEFRSIANDLLVTLDGTEYYRSDRVHCTHCHVTRHNNGKISYKHMLITPAIVKDGRKDVIAMTPEFIRTTDGAGKNENELSAAKRWLDRMGEKLNPLSITIMGDDLYSNQPFLSKVREHEMNFLCVCKSESHKYLYECVLHSRSKSNTSGVFIGR